MDEIGGDALRRNPGLEVLAPFLGVWRTSGSHPVMPGQVLEGRISFAWHEGGAFVIMHSEMRQPEVPPGVAIFGSDDNGDMAMLYFDRRGVSRHYRVSVDEREMRWSRDDSKFSQRMRLTLSADGSEISQTGQLREEGGVWQEDLTLSYRRIPLEATSGAGTG